MTLDGQIVKEKNYDYLFSKETYNQPQINKKLQYEDY